MSDDAKTEAEADSRRLFVGGLHEEVTSTDLQQRFGRFGSIMSIDVRTKRDFQGQVVNVFAYIDISISETNFKKCLSTYHDARWKGRTMKVQVAKEDFLAKLAKERKELQENREPLKPLITKTRKMKEQDEAKARLEENLKKAGVEDFFMKKAVPGTPIPGETNWIVGKFGRVLPIMHMHMQRKDKRSQMTYDPSKYTHHLRKFKDDAKIDQIVSESPVENLTWHLPDEASDLTRKRMGEFPDYVRKKKTKATNRGIVVKDDVSKRAGLHLWESNDDKQSRGEKFQLSEQDFEIVSLKLNGASGSHNPGLVKLKPYSAKMQESGKADQNTNQLEHRNEVQDLLQQCTLESDEDSCGSADTDEICNLAKKTPKPNTEDRQALTDWAKEYFSKERMAVMSGNTEEVHGLRQDDTVGLQEHSLSSSSPTEKSTGAEIRPTEARTSSVFPRTSKGANGWAREVIQKEDVEDVGDTDDDDSEHEVSDEEDMGDEGQEGEDADVDKSKDGYDYNDVDDDDGNDDDDDVDDDNSEAEEEDVNELPRCIDLNTRDNNEIHRNKSTKEDLEAGTRNNEDTKDESDNDDEDFSSDDDNSDCSDDRHSSKDDSDSDSEDSSDSNQENKTPEDVLSVGNSDSNRARRTSVDSAGDQSKPKLSDKIRLESVKKRQATILTRKAAVQEALKAVDIKRGSISAGTHVRFDSDDDSSEAESTPNDKAVTSKSETTIRKQPDLFDSDDGDEEEEMETNDEERFKIKPQFQGKAGEKLLKLQDRIGVDSRFKLGEMFMEDGESDDDAGKGDEDLKAEKQKSLSVLEGIVGSQAMHSLKNKTTSNFRDPSRVRYDPTKQNHARFEVTGTSASDGSLCKKSGGATDDGAIPEVSKDTYYEVADLAFNQDSHETKPFSFFGDDQPDDGDDDDKEGFSSLQKDLQASTALGKRQLTLDSSDNESEEDEVKHDGKDDADKMTVDVTPSDQPTSAHRAFFFQPDDIRLKTGPKLFCRKLSLEGMNQWFEEQKAELQGEYKKRHQRALRDSKKAAQQSTKKSRR